MKLNEGIDEDKNNNKNIIKSKINILEKTDNELNFAKYKDAINYDKRLTESETIRLFDEFVSVTTPKAKKDVVIKRVDIRKGRVKKVVEPYYNYQEEFIRDCEQRNRITFRLEDPHRAEYSKGDLDSEIIDSFENNTYGFAVTTYTISEKTIYVVYVDKYKLAVATDAENLVIVANEKAFGSNDDLKFELDVRDKDKSINAWLDRHYKGTDGYLKHFKLKITMGKKGSKMMPQFKDFKRRFKNYWVRNLNETIEERTVTHELKDKKGQSYVESFVICDAVFELDANISSFENWYLDLKEFDDVVILEPAFLNELYLLEKINRYAERINKYGGRLNITINKEYKPEYLEYMGEKIDYDKKMRRHLTEGFIKEKND